MSEEITQEFFWIPRLRDLKQTKKRAVAQYKILKWALFSIDLVFFTLFFSSFLIALFIGSGEYNPIYNAISDLGSSTYTPVAYLFDISLWICALLMCISIYIIKNQNPSNLRKNKYPSLFSCLKNIGFIFGIIAGLGLLIAAIFSVDRVGLGKFYHYIGAVLFFGGAVISISSLNICKTYYKPDIKGFLGYLSPSAATIALTFWFLTGLLLFEWIAFLSILSYLLVYQIKFLRGVEINAR